MKPDIFLTRTIPEMPLLDEFATVDLWEEDTPPPYDTLLARTKGKDGLLCLLTDTIDANLMDQTGLRVISQMAVGYDNIDVQAATERGIPVGNTPGVLTETTADFAFTLLMAAARRIVEGVDYVKAGRWQTWDPTLLMGADIHGATLGIVGYGRIGQAVAKRAQGFAMRVLYASRSAHPEGPPAEHVSLDDLLAEADFISLHVPLSDETHYLIDADAFERMKPTAVLINTARGPVIDPDALYTALTEGQIAYAALDVTEPEPLPAEHALVDLPNCLIVPHIGSSSRATRGRMARMAIDNLRAGLQGERLPNCVNPAVYEANG